MKITFPTFNAVGDISMTDVMYASFQDFIESGLDVSAILHEALIGLIDRRSHPAGAAAAVAHELLKKYKTQEGHDRLPGYQLTPAYCLAYKVYTFLTETAGLHTSDDDAYRLQYAIDKVGCEIEHLLDKGALRGPCPEPLPIQKGDFIVIPKGTPYSTTRKAKQLNGKQPLIGRVTRVTVHSVSNGYYGRKVNNPTVTWVGSGGYFCTTEMRNVNTGMVWQVPCVD